jgi:hypothetical protein
MLTSMFSYMWMAWLVLAVAWLLGDGLPDCLNMLLTPLSLAVLCVSVVRACRAISRSLLS